MLLIVRNWQLEMYSESLFSFFFVLIGRDTGRLCMDTRYKCCLDGITAATGPNYEGCPDDCNVSSILIFYCVKSFLKQPITTLHQSLVNYDWKKKDVLYLHTSLEGPWKG